MAVSLEEAFRAVKEGKQLWLVEVEPGGRQHIQGAVPASADENGVDLLGIRRRFSELYRSREMARKAVNGH